MPPRGRKPKPESLKVIQGTTRKDRMNEDAPKPDLSIPVPGDHLSPEALMEWGRISRELHKLGLLTEIDRPALEAYCQAYGRWVAAEREMKKPDFSMIIITPKGAQIQNPLIGIANTSVEIMRKFLTEFGMTPSSRSRVIVPKEKTKKNAFGAMGS